MSFLIDWTLLQDGELASQLQAWINQRFSDMDSQRPAFLGPLSVTHLSFGDTPPTIAISDITNVIDEFYLPDDVDIHSTLPNAQNLALQLSHVQSMSNSHLDSSSSASSSHSPGKRESDHFSSHHHIHNTPSNSINNSNFKKSNSVEDIVASYAESMRRDTDFQIEILVDYNGDFKLSVQTELIVNQPTPAFITLPLSLTLTGFSFTAIAVISYLGDRINFCFKDMGDNPGLFSNISIDSEIGDRDRQVLKNVGKIEKFVVEQVKAVVSDHFVYPNYHCLSLINEDAEEGDYEDDEHFGQS
ncbi:Mitochondrial distribution and morphology protein 12 [Chytriomyces hyalinus]|nr:Mitochondrial distribution and morphology protein 12 [Chytriomyces hyalinus]